MTITELNKNCPLQQPVSITPITLISYKFLVLQASGTVQL